MATNLIDLTGFAELLNDIVEGADSREERDHLRSVIDRIKDGEPMSEPWKTATVG